ncbi:hypothetical protein [Hyalangium rubrum]|uniref:PEGA domain-containing protein n=1 Tax=Hyalangium rubrum TaxID=3103134 RepID=A0ABU5H1U5_9BACT|nr:hypothetical protein [Hyalangium sp. s54d21]MDY7227291.1 hypothetical protein [Hyalangium sp. s54d21]
MEKTRTDVLRVLVLLMVAWVATPAFSQPSTELDAGKQPPWARDVPRERQLRAEALLQQANAHWLDSRFVAAEAKYREALGLWDHPVTHFNLSQILATQGRHLELHKHITQAMRFGDAPLGKEKFSRAQFLKTVAEQQLGRVEISCDVSDASVWVGEKRLLQCPGKVEELMLPGTYTLSTRRKGYPDNDRTRALLAGKTVSLHITQLYDEEDFHVQQGRWPTWKPWSVVGAGVLMAGGGGLLHLQARNNYRAFDQRASRCGPEGCDADPTLAGKIRRGDNFQKLAIGSYALAGATAVTGAVLVLLNREKAVLRTPDELDGVNVSLTVGKAESGFLATWRF